MEHYQYLFFRILIIVFTSISLLIFQNRARNYLVGIAAILSIFSFLNFGQFHLPQNEKIHYWDAFHYYIGAKYFNELRYGSLYTASYVAGKEAGIFSEITSIRDLNSYSVIPVSLIDEPRVKARFSPERWEEFKKDIKFFYEESKRPDSAWQKLLSDHGFNAPPLKSVLMSKLLNCYELNSFTLNLTVSADYILIALLFFIIAISINFYPACIFIILFSLNPISPFDFTFGSVLRYDWFFALGTSLIAASKERFKLSAIALAISAHCRVFPFVFALSVILSLLKYKTKLKDFILYFTSTIIIGVLVATIFSKDLTIFPEFMAKMSTHTNVLYSNTVGIKSLFLSDVFINKISGSALSESEIAKLITERKSISVICGFLLSLPVILFSLKKSNFKAFCASCLLIFLLLNPVNYYYAFLAFASLYHDCFVTRIYNLIIVLILFAFLIGQIVLSLEPNMLLQNIAFSALAFLMLILLSTVSQKGKVSGT